MRFVFETGKLELDSQDLLTGAAFLINLVSEVINSVDVTIDRAYDNFFKSIKGGL